MIIGKIHMPDNKHRILEDLHVLLSHNVIGDKQYASRYKGFRGELEFSNLVRNKKINSVSGGAMISRVNGNDPFTNAAYFNVIRENNLDNASKLLEYLAPLNFEKMFIVTYNDDYEGWKEEDIMGFGYKIHIPDFKFYEYNLSEKTLTYISDEITHISNYYDSFKGDRKKNSYPINDETKIFFINQLTEYNLYDLMDLYANRILFDGFIGFSKIRGIPTDIDSVIFNDGIFLCEIKEKDLSKRPPRGFGMDLHRINDILHISTKSNLPYHYIVRHINNQVDREFIEWKCIPIETFYKITNTSKIIQGGHGMRSINSNNPTKVCPYEKFYDLGKKIAIEEYHEI